MTTVKHILYLLIISILLINCNNQSKTILRDDPELGNKKRLQDIAELKTKYRESGVRLSSIFLEFYFGMAFQDYQDHLRKCIGEGKLKPFYAEIKDTLQDSEYEEDVVYKYIFHAVNLGRHLLHNTKDSAFYDYHLICQLNPKFHQNRLYELELCFWGLGSSVYEDGWVVDGLYEFKIIDFFSIFEILETYDLKYGESIALFNNNDEFNQFYWVKNNLELLAVEETRNLSYFELKKSEWNFSNENKYDKKSIIHKHGLKIIYRDYFVFDPNKEQLLKNEQDIKGAVRKLKEINKKNQFEKQENETKSKIKDI